ncbi:hypothetical protein QYF61_019133 [Mycteria americana]|uniref:RING-type domain-containing protein n=1 Tax=Mycteria americana TaxID=33587 RepID=A0AAN7N2R6_MYCAM|nr:hypothetical protein QYF61_019133 [Mycteria americana]
MNPIRPHGLVNIQLIQLVLYNFGVHKWKGLEERCSRPLRNLDFLRADYLKEDKELILTQRKRRGGAANSRQARKRNRLVASTAEMASEAEPTELEESAGEEVVDLTCESSDPVVVDLTHNDSVVVSKNEQQRRNLILRGQRQLDICILISDDEDETRDSDVYIVQSGRLIVSTKCGHVFCSQCLRDSLRNANSCPTCRKKLTHRQRGSQGWSSPPQTKLHRSYLMCRSRITLDPMGETIQR